MQSPLVASERQEPGSLLVVPLGLDLGDDLPRLG